MTTGHYHTVFVDWQRSGRRGEITETNNKRSREMVNPLSAISIQSNDGAEVHDITCRNYRVDYALTPLFIILQPRNRYGETKRGDLYNITVDNLQVDTCYRNAAILAADGYTIRNVRLTDVCAVNRELPQDEYFPTIPTGKEYPDIFHFAPFPAYGLFARNAQVIAEGCDFREAYESGRPPIDK